MKFLKQLIKDAQKNPKTIIFPEAGFSDRIVKAVKKIQKKHIAKVVLVGDESSLVLQDKKLKEFTIINPKTCAYKDALAQELFELRKDKGLTREQADELILDPFYFSTMFVYSGFADGMVSGAEVSTARSLKPAFLPVKVSSNSRLVTSASSKNNS